jgi:hypothetical protein
MQVAVRGGGRCVAKPFHEIFGRCASGSGEGLTGMAQVMKPEAGHVGHATCTGEGLAYGVTAHWLAIAANECAVGPGPVAHISSEDRQHVRRNCNGAFARVGLGRGIESLAGFEKFDTVGPDRDGTSVQVDVLGGQMVATRFAFRRVKTLMSRRADGRRRCIGQTVQPFRRILCILVRVSFSASDLRRCPHSLHTLSTGCTNRHARNSAHLYPFCHLHIAALSVDYSGRLVLVSYDVSLLVSLNAHTSRIRLIILSLR